jgi:hypothetical protein
MSGWNPLGSLEHGGETLYAFHAIARATYANSPLSKGSSVLALGA